MELADISDLKSDVRNNIPVRFRAGAPLINEVR